MLTSTAAGTVIMVTFSTMTHTMTLLAIHLFLNKRASFLLLPPWNTPRRLRLFHETLYTNSLLATYVQRLAYDHRRPLANTSNFRVAYDSCDVESDRSSMSCPSNFHARTNPEMLQIAPNRKDTPVHLLFYVN